MMPFYGETPPEAAQRLTEWLTLAHARLNTRTA
jgi:predicted RNase H-like HicB family nuclease